ncbi:MAG: hypothetical protein ACHQWU_09920 [Gemmatimonadales bacterium]|jgi:hypothetical protein
MRAFPLPLLVALVALACDQPAVEWADPVPIVEPSFASRLAVDSSGAARYLADTVSVVVPPSASGACPSSVVNASDSTSRFAVWWRARHDSSAALYAARTADGGRSWGAAFAVDTSDVSTRGCSRPPPAVAVLGDDVFVAYAMAAPEGTGVFSAHTMSGMVHSPVATTYGDHLVSVSIAVQGSSVAVAYEEPNGSRPRVSVALSRTQGHIFESHLTASRDVDDAMAPAVALDGSWIAVSWSSTRSSDGATSRVVRVGHLP